MNRIATYGILLGISILITIIGFSWAEYVEFDVFNMSYFDIIIPSPLDEIQSYGKILDRCDFSDEKKHILSSLLFDAEKEFTLTGNSTKGYLILDNVKDELIDCGLKPPQESSVDYFDMPIFDPKLIGLLGFISSIVLGVLTLREKKKRTSH